MRDSGSGGRLLLVQPIVPIRCQARPR